jgi:hypothetical protein
MMRGLMLLHRSRLLRGLQMVVWPEAARCLARLRQSLRILVES